MIKKILLFLITTFVGNISIFSANVEQQPTCFVDVDYKPVSIPHERLEPTENMRAETICIVRCLEELHYQHRDLSELNNEEILTEYFSSLDYNRMFFLESELAEYRKRFVATLDIFIGGGSLMPAFTIFENYRKNVNERVDWIIDRLNQAFDFTTDETYIPIRNKSDWPATQSEADALWEKCLKYEFVNELLANKDNDQDFANDDDPEALQSYTGDVVVEELTSGITESNKISRKVESSQDLKIDSNSEALPSLESGDVVVEEEVDVAKKTSGTKTKISEQKPDESYENAKRNIIKHYKNMAKYINELDPWFVEELFLNSITRLYDPHSAFMSKDTFNDFEIIMKNSLIGIGVLLMCRDDYCIIEQVYDGSPAANSKQIKHGDKILEVSQGEDGEFVEIIGMPLNKSIKLIRGEKGTVVRLKIQPADGDPSDRKIVSMVRDIVPLFAKRAHANIYTIKGEKNFHKIGLIVLPSSFYGPNDNEPNSDLANDTKELINKLKQENVEGIILDLRNNGGGLVDQAVNLTSLFVDNCPVYMTKNSFGIIKTFNDNADKAEWDGRLIVLTSMNSASATEIFAGALRDYKRALIVGTPKTHGKGTVQTLVPIGGFFSANDDSPNMGAAKITIQKWYSPKGQSAQLKGVESDIQLESYDMFVPYHEINLPHALDGDSIAPAEINLEAVTKSIKYPITDDLIYNLRAKSQNRKDNFDEFKLQREDIERFKSNIEQKEFSLNLQKRKEKKRLDALIKTNIKDKFDKLKQLCDLESKKVELDAVIAKYNNKKNGKTDDNNEDLEDDFEVSKSYNVKDFDVNLREGLRIMVDWIEIDDLKVAEQSTT